jgi:uncharacterized membrane protein (GlpM family)
LKLVVAGSAFSFFPKLKLLIFAVVKLTLQAEAKKTAITAIIKTILNFIIFLSLFKFEEREKFNQTILILQTKKNEPMC